MSDLPSVPPIYRLVTVGPKTDACARALGMADAAEEGTLVWSRRDDVLDCAVVLRPEEPLEPSLLVAYVGALGLGDALASTLPPGVEVSFGWPTRVAVNERDVGDLRIRFADCRAAGDVPRWLVLGATVAVTGEPPGRGKGWKSRTTLHFEQCDEITPAALLEAFSRHLLVWINRWLDDGFEPVRTAWLARARESGLKGLDDHGGLVLEKGGRTRTKPLRRGLAVRLG